MIVKQFFSLLSVALVSLWLTGCDSKPAATPAPAPAAGAGTEEDDHAGHDHAEGEEHDEDEGANSGGSSY